MKIVLKTLLITATALLLRFIAVDSFPSLQDVKLMEQFVEDVMDNAPATTFYESFKEKFGDNTSNITNTEYQEWLNTEIHPTFRMVLDDPSENAKFKRFVEEKRNVVNSLRSNLRKY
eukprot:GHVN01043746.1.p1 GENE.GHVN01043746.1~~GHVN01043746.1.p1  ORF type:complete len:117 (-),score=12.14 GHVN01043746.1:253-603(-)